MNKHIVLADDDISVREGIIDLTKQLESGTQESYRINAFENGQDAWNFIKTHSIDLLITDISMPIMDGYTLINTLAEHGYKMPILIFSGFFDESRIIRYDGKIIYQAKPLITRDNERIFQNTIQDLLK